MTVPHVRERIRRLREEIDRHNYQYYVLDQPLVSDADYDRLFRELQQLESQHPELVTPDSPTQRVGAKPLSSFAPLRHRTPMLSLNNAFEAEEVAAFDRRVREALLEILGDDPRLVDDEVAVDQRRHRLVRVQVDQVLGRLRGVGLDEPDVESLLEDDDPHALTRRVVATRIKRHHAAGLRGLSRRGAAAGALSRRAVAAPAT